MLGATPPEFAESRGGPRTGASKPGFAIDAAYGEHGVIRDLLRPPDARTGIAAELHVRRAQTFQIHYDLDFDALTARLNVHAAPAADDVFIHVVNASTLPGGRLAQIGAGPNFDGGLISLCACNHGMRATLGPTEWRGRWIAGFTSYSGEFGHQQYLRYLMRVGEAYASHHELEIALIDSGREHVLDAKDASRHAAGDIWRVKPGAPKFNARWRASNYYLPMIGHAHRGDIDDETWHKDIEYADQYGRRPALLVGDPGWSFVWTQPFICRTDPGPLRRHQRISVDSLLMHLRSNDAGTTPR